MVEKQTQKRARENQQPTAEIQLAAAEKRSEVTPQTLEQAEKQHKSDQLEREALAKAAELAEKADEARDEEETQKTKAIERHRGAPSKKQLKESFNSEMKNVRTEMNLGERMASRFLHSAPIEKTSEFVSTTLARPNAMLSGSIAAFVCITLVYFVARHYGYQLSGFETIVAFVLGWVIGIVYDYVIGLIRRR